MRKIYNYGQIIRAKRQNKNIKAINLAKELGITAAYLSLKESNVVPYLNRLSDFLWSAARWQEGESVTTKSISVSE